ncbi:unnamed protein product, partial [Ixodes pacificus]
SPVAAVVVGSQLCFSFGQLAFCGRSENSLHCSLRLCLSYPAKQHWHPRKLYCRETLSVQVSNMTRGVPPHGKGPHSEGLQMGMLSRDPNYGSTHEFPNKDCPGSLDSDSEYSGGLPILKESLERDANIDAHSGTEVSSLKISPQWLKVKALAWVIPVVYTHFWLAAVISLLAPYFPPLVSFETAYLS